ILAPPTRRLRKQRDVAELHGGNDQASAGRHQAGLSWLAPVLDALGLENGRQRIEPAEILGDAGPHGTALRDEGVELAWGVAADVRSEERRVGKEGRSRW